MATGTKGSQWTVGKLRAALGDLPDSLPVEVIMADGDEQVITSAGPWAHVAGRAAEVRARIASGALPPDHFEIGCEFLEDLDGVGEGWHGRGNA